MADLSSKGSKGAIEPKHDWSTAASGLASYGWKGAIEPVSSAAGGPTIPILAYHYRNNVGSRL